MIGGHLRRVVMFPDDAYPDLCGYVADGTGGPRAWILRPAEGVAQ